MGWAEAAINFAFSDANGGERVDWEHPGSVLNLVKKDGNNLARIPKSCGTAGTLFSGGASKQDGFKVCHRDKRRADQGNCISCCRAESATPCSMRPRVQRRIQFVNEKP